jgi:hypothetical protein
MDARSEGCSAEFTWPYMDECISQVPGKKRCPQVGSDVPIVNEHKIGTISAMGMPGIANTPSSPSGSG